MSRVVSTDTFSLMRDISEKADLSLSRSESKFSALDFICWVTDVSETKQGGNRNLQLEWYRSQRSTRGDGCTLGTAARHQAGGFLVEVTVSGTT